MRNRDYQVEFDGVNYVVVKAGRVLAAFGSCEEAYDVKRKFESTQMPVGWQKVPPAMQLAKRYFYGKSVSV